MSFDSVSEDIPIWGDLVGASGRQAGRRAAAAAADQRAQREKQDIILRNLGMAAPSVESQMVDPAMEGTVEQLGPSAFQGAAADPEAIAAQRQALAGLATPEGALNAMLAGGGLDAQERQQIATNQRNAALQAQSGRQAAMRGAAARGMLGGGGELAGQLSAQQGAADIAAQQGLGIDALAADRKMQVIQGLQSLQGARAAIGGQMRGQSWNEAGARASAADQIAAQNAEWRQGRAVRNTEAQRQGQYHNAGLAQQGWENQARVAEGRANVAGSRSSDSLQRERDEQARRQASMDRFTNMAGGIAKAGVG